MMDIFWRGWDESLWDLMRGPMRITAQAMDVLGAFDSEAFVATSAYVDGQRLLHWKASPREFPLQVQSEEIASTQAWAALDYRWKRTMRPDKFGELIVSDVTGGTRILTARMRRELNELDTDPSDLRDSFLTYEMTADDPWWYADVDPTVFTPPEEKILFFGPTGFGPPFHIAPGSTPAAAQVLNSGDVDAWPVWTFHGPAPRFSASVCGQVISHEAPIDVGEWVTVDTRPFKKSAIRSDGTNITRQLSSRRFARIPSGESAAVEVALFEGSRVELLVRPQFFRGFN